MLSLIKALQVHNAQDKVCEYDRHVQAKCILDMIEKTGMDKPLKAHSYECMREFYEECKIFLRKRIGIDQLLEIKSLNIFLQAATPASIECHDELYWRMYEEILKCVMNILVDRPVDYYTSMLQEPWNCIQKLQKLVNIPTSCMFQYVGWKNLLACCESSQVCIYIAEDGEFWLTIYGTLYYVYYAAPQENLPFDKSRLDLISEILKLVAVLLNQLDWKESPMDLLTQTMNNVHRFEKLLVHIISGNIGYEARYLLDIRNRMVECCLCLPSNVLRSILFSNECKAGDVLNGLLNYLTGLLVFIRVEKIIDESEILPLLLVLFHLCHQAEKDEIATFVIRYLQKRLFGDAVSLSCTGNPAPDCFLWYHLQYFLTSLNTQVKRYASEWLYILCNENAKIYTQRFGIGRSIGLLRMKGIA